MISFWLAIIILFALVFYPLIGRLTQSKYNRVVLMGLALLSFVLYIYLGAGNQLAEHEQITHQAKMLKRQLGDVKTREVIVEKIQERLKTHPDDAEGWFLLGRLQMSLGHQHKAIYAYQKAHAIMPNNVTLSIVYLKSVLAVNTHLTHAQKQLLAKALSNHPNDQNLLSLAALLAYQQHEYQRAVNLWRRALPHYLPGSSDYKQVKKMIEQSKKLGAG